MSEEDLFTAKGDMLLRLIQAGATKQLVEVAPNWTQEGAKEFSGQLAQLFRNIGALPGSNQLGATNHRYLIQAKLDCLEAASRVDNDLFKEFYAKIGFSTESFQTDFRRHWRRAYSFPNRSFMKLWAFQVAHDLRRQSR